MQKVCVRVLRVVYIAPLTAMGARSGGVAAPRYFRGPFNKGLPCLLARCIIYLYTAYVRVNVAGEKRKMTCLFASLLLIELCILGLETDPEERITRIFLS